MMKVGDLVRAHVARVYGNKAESMNSAIRIGDLVRGHHIRHKIGVVTKIDDVAEMAFVQYTDTNKSWEPLANLRRATA
jgi:hypothetical protein